MCKLSISRGSFPDLDAVDRDNQSAAMTTDLHLENIGSFEFRTIAFSRRLK